MVLQSAFFGATLLHYFNQGLIVAHSIAAHLFDCLLNPGQPGLQKSTDWYSARRITWVGLTLVYSQGAHRPYWLN